MDYTFSVIKKDKTILSFETEGLSKNKKVCLDYAEDAVYGVSGKKLLNTDYETVIKETLENQQILKFLLLMEKRRGHHALHPECEIQQLTNRITGEEEKIILFHSFNNLIGNLQIYEEFFSCLNKIDYESNIFDLPNLSSLPKAYVKQVMSQNDLKFSAKTYIDFIASPITEQLTTEENKFFNEELSHEFITNNNRLYNIEPNETVNFIKYYYYNFIIKGFNKMEYMFEFRRGYNNYLNDRSRLSQYLQRDFPKYPDHLLDTFARLRLLTTKMEEEEKARKEITYLKRFKVQQQEIFNFIGSSFIVICSQNPEDLITEGKYQGNCLARGYYKNDIVEGECAIAFARKKTDPNTPWITLQIKTGENRCSIIQKQVRYNHDLSANEEILIGEYKRYLEDLSTSQIYHSKKDELKKILDEVKKEE